MTKTYKNLAEFELAKLSKQNDKKAIEELLLRIQKEIAIFFQYFDPNFENLNDLTQEVLLKVVRKIKYLRNDASFKSWLHKIVINTYYDFIRKKNMKKLTVPLDLERNIFIDVEDSRFKPHDDTLYKEMQDKIKGALMRINADYRLVLLLKDCANLKYQDISEIIGVNVGTVKSRHARAKQKLYQNLRGYL